MHFHRSRSIPSSGATREEIQGSRRWSRKYGGITNSGALQLQNDQITSNSGIANGTDGWAQGGGIWNGPLFDSPPVLLTISHTTIQHNSVDGNGITADGGGLYTLGFPATLMQSTISQNNPNDCAGC